jgi:hypothetical protein
MTRALIFSIITVFISCAPSHKEILYVDLIEDTVINHPGVYNNYVNDREVNLYTDTINGKKYTNRLLFKFNNVPLKENQTIDSVLLYLYYNDRSYFFKNGVKGHKSIPELSVQRIISEWNPHTISWKDSLQLSTQKATELVKKAYQDIRINISAIMVENGQLLSSTGIFLKFTDEQPFKYVHLTSLDGYEKDRVSKLKVYVTNN